MHTPSPSLTFLKILWNFSIKLLSLHEIISIIVWSWFKFPLITVKPGQALAQRVHQWIDYLKIESVSRCMCNEQWISGYYFQYLGRIFTAHYAAGRNTEMDLKSTTTYRVNFRITTLKFIGIFGSGGGGGWEEEVCLTWLCTVKKTSEVNSQFPDILLLWTTP